MPCGLVVLGADSTLASHSIPTSHVIRTTSALAKDVKVTDSDPKVSEVSQDAETSTHRHLGCKASNSLQELVFMHSLCEGKRPTRPL
jgi:hypothetical protein